MLLDADSVPPASIKSQISSRQGTLGGLMHLSQVLSALHLKTVPAISKFQA